MTAVRVPLTRFDSSDPILFSRLTAAVEALASRAAFTLGAEVEAFETEFANYCETAHCVGVASGTDALVLSLRALAIGPGDEVILPANTFIATAEAVSIVGATPRIVDVDRDTQLLTAEIAAQAVGPHTRCIIPVHLYGRTVDMDPLLALAAKAGLRVVEDACQAHGARYRGRRVGSLGDAGCFSFYPAKNLGAWGDGGAVVSNSSEVADHVRLLRSHGESPRYHHQAVGSTARLDALQAAVLRVKLRQLEDWNERRRSVGVKMGAALAGTPVLTPLEPAPGTDDVYHQYVVVSDHRDELREHLESRGIASAIHYPIPVHRCPAFTGLGLGPGSLPVAEGLSERICSLPMFPGMSDAEIDAVADAVAAFTPQGAEVAA